jgi:hypothetical protein
VFSAGGSVGLSLAVGIAGATRAPAGCSRASGDVSEPLLVGGSSQKPDEYTSPVTGHEYEQLARLLELQKQTGVTGTRRVASELWY